MEDTITIIGGPGITIVGRDIIIDHANLHLDIITSRGIPLLESTTLRLGDTTLLLGEDTLLQGDITTGDKMENGRKPCVEKCIVVNCQKIVEHDGEKYCECYLDPSYWWDETNPYRSKCPIPKVEPEVAKKLKVINPLKAAKLREKGSLRLGYVLRKAKYDSKWQKERGKR